MNIDLPYQNFDLNVQYLISKNTEANTTASMITLCFLMVLFLMYNLSNSVINNYKSKNLQLHYIIYLKQKHKLELDLSDLPKISKILKIKQMNRIANRIANLRPRPGVMVMKMNVMKMTP